MPKYFTKNLEDLVRKIVVKTSMYYLFITNMALCTSEQYWENITLPTIQ